MFNCLIHEIPGDHRPPAFTDISFDSLMSLLSSRLSCWTSHASSAVLGEAVLVCDLVEPIEDPTCRYHQWLHSPNLTLILKNHLRKQESAFYPFNIHLFILRPLFSQQSRPGVIESNKPRPLESFFSRRPRCLSCLQTWSLRKLSNLHQVLSSPGDIKTKSLSFWLKKHGERKIDSM